VLHSGSISYSSKNTSYEAPHYAAFSLSTDIRFLRTGFTLSYIVDDYDKFKSILSFEGQLQQKAMHAVMLNQPKNTPIPLQL
jgi:hypothetical protein